MATKITLPKLSDTMEEGKVLRWLKQVGDSIAAGEVVAEVETDKADMEVEAEESGVLSEIRVGPGETAAVGAVLAVLNDSAAPRPPAAAKSSSTADADASASSAAPAAVAEPTADEERGRARPPKAGDERPSEAEKTPAPRRETPAREAAATAGAPSARPLRVSPLAQRLARERGVDLGEVRGSGADGKIVARDLGAPESKGRGDEPALVPGRLELSKMRQSIARRMAEAKHGVPHFYVSAEIDMGEALRLLAALKERVDERLTVSHLVVKAAALALVEHPRVNGQWDEGAVRIPEHVNIGLAVAVDDGLIVPVIHECDRLSLAELAAEARRLVGAARDGRFSGDDLKGGTFSISNLGMFQVDEFSAILNQPQAAILAVAAVRPRPVVRAGALAVAETMRVTLSCDHRQLNGVEAARFLETFRSILEQPLQMVV